MNSKILLHILVLLSAVMLIFFWTSDVFLAQYSLQLTAALVVILIITHHILKPASFKLAESTVITMSVLLIISTTGGLSSPLFFLNYLLLFELSIILEPIIPIFLSIALGSYFLLSQSQNASAFTYLAVLSFPLVTPFAYLFGQIYAKVKNQKKEIRNLEKKLHDLKEITA